MSLNAALEQATSTVEALERETKMPHGWRVNGLLADAHASLMWAVDEIEQLRDERREGVQLAVKLATKIADLEDLISEYETAEILADQRLDFLLASR